MRGINSQTSLVDNFMTNIDGTHPDNLDAFTSRLAFDAYLIDTIPGSYNYDTPVLLPVDQMRKISSTGGTGQWNFALGLNFSDTWYLGMGLGINHLAYTQKTTHTEYDRATSQTDFDRFVYTEDLDVEGTGINFNIGTMVRLFKILRIGASLHLPTYYKFDEAYRNTMYSEFKSGFIPSDQNGQIYSEGSFKYKLVTPLKLLGGASVQIGKVGIVSADLEYINYNQMQLREREDVTDFQNENDQIKNVYRSVINLKMGGEARFDKLFVRIGGGVYQSPYNAAELNKAAGHSEVTAGFGYRSSSFFFDLGFSTLFHTEKYLLYSAYEYNPDPLVDPVYVNHIANLKQQKYRFVASLGFRF
jgi:long-subunit fatty acid transport protein